MASNCLVVAAAWIVVGSFGVEMQSGAWGADTSTSDGVVLRVRNDIPQEIWPKPVTFQIGSQWPASAKKPRVKYSIKPGETVKIPLKGRDQFIAEVRYEKWTYKTRPMPLTQALQKDPSRVLHISQIFSNPDPTRRSPELEVRLGPEELLKWREQKLLDEKAEKELNQRLNPGDASGGSKGGRGIIQRWRQRRRR